VIHTQISSPVPAVINGLSKGDVLRVELKQGLDTHIVELTFKGKVAGGLSSAQVVKLIDCIRGGTQYQAEVQEANGGQVKVKVKAI